MKQIIENVRQRPPEQKSKIVWIIAGCVAGVLLLAWAFIGIPNRNTNPGDVINNFNSDVQESKDTIPNLLENQ